MSDGGKNDAGSGFTPSNPSFPGKMVYQMAIYFLVFRSLRSFAIQ